MKKRFYYLLPLILLLIIGVAGWVMTDYLGNKARQEIIRESQASVLTLSIYVSTTINVIENAVKTLAGSPWIVPALLSKGEQDIAQANRTLDRYGSDFSSITYLMDADGMTVASSNRKDPDSFVGKSYSFRPYFQKAANGQPGRYFALGITTGKRGFYASCPVRNDSAEVIGVVTMKKDIDEIETFFNQYPFCFLISPEGMIFLSGKPAMITKSLWPLDKTVRETLIASRQFGDTLSEALVNKEIADGEEVALENEDFFVSRKVINSDGWSIVLLTPTDRIGAYRWIGILTTISVSFLIMVFSSIIYITNRSREALHQSEESKRLLLYAVGEGIFGVDTTGRVTFANPAALRMLGFAEEEVLSQDFHSLIRHSHENGPHSPDKDRPMSAFFTHAADNPVADGVLWRKDGSSFPVEYAGMPITKDGKVMGAVVSFRDITERKRAEAALLSEKKIIDAIMDSAPGIIYLYDDHAKLVRWNKNHEHMTGYSSAELYGMHVLDWFKGDEKSLSAVTEGLKNTAVNGFGEAEAEVQRKDGTIMPMYLTACPLNMEGKPYFVGIGIDITDRKRIDAERTLLSSVVEQAEENVLITDDRRTILYINPAFERSSGYSCEELRGQKLKKLRSDQHDEAFYHTTKKILDRGQVWTGVIMNKGKNGMIFEIEGTISPIRDVSGTITHFVAVGRNMSRFRRLERELQQAQKLDALGTLAGGIAHDFNNLLMGIQGRTSLISLDLETSHPHLEHLHAIEEYIHSATSLTRQLLGFARGGKYEVKPVDMNALVLGSSAMFGRTRKEIKIHTKCPESPLVVEADRDQIEQVLLNMYINAWQAMPPEGGELYLETKTVSLDEDYCKPHQAEPGRYVNVSITDTGSGMDETTRQRIFDPFFTTKEKSHGTGLGLASAYGIIKNHGGMITVYSELGHGTTFNIYLPVSEKNTDQEVPREGVPLMGSATILLVDDEEMILDVGQAMLERLGYHVMTCSGGPEAIQAIADRGKEIDLVILDLIMPGLDGGTTFDGIRKLQPDMPVLLSSGYAINGHADKIMQRGCSGFIQKPYNITELSQKIRNVLGASPERL